MSSKKILVYTIPVLVIGLIAWAVHLYNKPEKSIATEKGYPLTAEELYQKFSSDEREANRLYLNKVLQVTGDVLEMKHNQQGEDVIVLRSEDPLFGTTCTLAAALPSYKKVKPGDRVVIKGICTGYLTDVVLVRGLVIE